MIGSRPTNPVAIWLMLTMITIVWLIIRFPNNFGKIFTIIVSALALYVLYLIIRGVLWVIKTFKETRDELRDEDFKEPQ